MCAGSQQLHLCRPRSLPQPPSPAERRHQRHRPAQHAQRLPPADNSRTASMNPAIAARSGVPLLQRQCPPSRGRNLHSSSSSSSSSAWYRDPAIARCGCGTWQRGAASRSLAASPPTSCALPSLGELIPRDRVGAFGGHPGKEPTECPSPEARPDRPDEIRMSSRPVLIRDIVALARIAFCHLRLLPSRRISDAMAGHLWTRLMGGAAANMAPLRRRCGG